MEKIIEKTPEELSNDKQFELNKLVDYITDFTKHIEVGNIAKRLSFYTMLKSNFNGNLESVIESHKECLVKLNLYHASNRLISFYKV
jgi:hypothetical protein